MDKVLLRYHMWKNGDSVDALAEALGVQAQTLYRKINAGMFKQKELSKIAERYKLDPAEFMKIFFV